MLRFAADENFNGDIVRGLLQTWASLAQMTSLFWNGLLHS